MRLSSLALCLLFSIPVLAEDPPVLKATVVVEAGKDLRRIPRTVYGTNTGWPSAGNGIVNFTTHAIQDHVVKLARDLGPTVVRFPGGTFADFYHWKEATGPFEKRPKTQAHAGEGNFEEHAYGTDEFLDFVKRVGAQPLITVNAVTGTAEEAAGWVRYVNGDPKNGGTPCAALWEIGNENYNKGRSTIEPAEYVKRFRAFAKAMRGADPRVKLMALGCEQFNGALVSDGLYTHKGFTGTVLRELGTEMDYLAIHNAYAPAIVKPEDQAREVRDVYRAMYAAPTRIAENLADLDRRIAKLVPKGGDKIRVAVTEWGPFFSFTPQERYTDHVKTLGSALFTASVLAVFVESPRVDVANHFQLIDPLFNGALSTRQGTPVEDFVAGKPGIFVPSAQSQALALFANRHAEIAVASMTASPVFDTPAVGWVQETKSVPWLVVTCARSETGDALTIVAINRHFDSPIDAAVTLKDFVPATTGRAWTLSGTAADAHPGVAPVTHPAAKWAEPAGDGKAARIGKGGDKEIWLKESDVAGVAAAWSYRFPARSVTLIRLEREVK